MDSDGDLATVTTGQKPEYNLTELEIKVHKTLAEFDALQKPWSALAEKTGARIFQTFEWNRIWWKHFGAGKELNIITIYEQKILVGIIPLFIDTVKVAGIRVYSSLRFIGSNVLQPVKNDLIGLISYSDYLDFIVTPGYESEINKYLTAYIRNLSPSTEELILNVVPGDSLIMRAFVPSWQKDGFDIKISQVNESQSVELMGDWEEYLKGLSKNSRSHTRRALKKTEEPGHKVFEISNSKQETDISEDFNELVAMHQKRWNRLGQLGTFAERTNYLFHHEISQIFWRKGWLQIMKVFCVNEQNRCIAMDLNYIYNGTIYGVHCAVDDSSVFYQKGPGNSLLCSVLRDACNNGVGRYDFLRGDESYKKTMANKSNLIFDVVVKNPNRKHSKLHDLFFQYAAKQRKIRREKEYLKFLISSRPFLQGIGEYGRRIIQKINSP